MKTRLKVSGCELKKIKSGSVLSTIISILDHECMRRCITALKIHTKAFSVVVIIYPKAGEVYFFPYNKKEGKL